MNDAITRALAFEEFGTCFLASSTLSLLSELGLRRMSHQPRQIKNESFFFLGEIKKKLEGAIKKKKLEGPFRVKVKVQG